MQHSYFGEMGSKKHFIWQNEMMYKNIAVKLSLEISFIQDTTQQQLDSFAQCFEKIELFDTKAKIAMQGYFSHKNNFLADKLQYSTIEEKMIFFELIAFNIYAVNDDPDREYLTLHYRYIATLQEDVELVAFMDLEGNVIRFAGIEPIVPKLTIMPAFFTVIIWSLLIGVLCYSKSLAVIKSIILLIVLVFLSIVPTTDLIEDWKSYRKLSSKKFQK